MNKLAFFLTLMTATFTLASPHPGVGSSKLVSVKNPAWFSSKNFQLNFQKIEDTNWQIVENKKNEVTLRLTSPSADNPLLVGLNFTTSVKLNTNLNEYTNLGFELLNSSKISSTQNVWIIDLVQQQQKIQMRQILIQTDKGTLTLNCTSSINSFAKYSKSCTDIYKNIEFK